MRIEPKQTSETTNKIKIKFILEKYYKAQKYR